MSPRQNTYRRLLVVANHTCPCPGLIQEAADLTTRPDGELLLVAPALNSRLKHWVSDTDAAVRDAGERLSDALEALTQHGVRARGQIGDADPRMAIDDALHGFAADAVLISTYPAGRSHWLERGLVEHARQELTVPVIHTESRYGLSAPMPENAAGGTAATLLISRQ